MKKVLITGANSYIGMNALKNGWLNGRINIVLRLLI